MTDKELDTELSVLGQNIADEQQSLDGYDTDQSVSVPKAMRGIPERIIGKWGEELKSKMTEADELANGPIWPALKYFFRKKFFDYDRRVHYFGNKVAYAMNDSVLVETGELRLKVAEGEAVEDGQELFITADGNNVNSEIDGVVKIRSNSIVVVSEKDGDYVGNVGIAVVGSGVFVFGLMVLIRWLTGEMISLTPILPLTALLAVLVMWFISYSALRKYRKDIQAEHEAAERELEQKTQRLWADPPFLISNVQDHLTEVTKSYRLKLTELEANFKNALVEPRAELKQKLTQFEADEKTLSELSDDEFPERSQFLELVRAQIAKCRELLDKATPQELELNGKFEIVKSRLAHLEQSSEGLASLKAKYENREQLLARFNGYAQVDSESWEKILGSKRQRELQEVETALRELNEEVAGTHGALNEVTAMLPSADFYRLPATPSTQLPPKA